MPKKIDCDVIILCAQDEEYSSVYKIFGTKPKTPPKKIKILNSTESVDFIVYNKHTITLFKIGDISNIPSALYTEKLLNSFNAKYIFFVGSACGRSDKTKVGDVVITTIVIDHRMSRLTNNGNPSPRWNMYSGNKKFTRQLREYVICESQRKPGSIHQRKAGSIHWRHIISDDNVINFTDSQENIRFFKGIHDSAYAYDMESAGFAYACSECEDTVFWVVVRGISDHGIEGSSKKHKIAAREAARWLSQCIKDLGIPPFV